MNPTNRVSILLGAFTFVCIGAFLWYTKQPSEEGPAIFGARTTSSESIITPQWASLVYAQGNYRHNGYGLSEGVVYYYDSKMPDADVNTFQVFGSHQISDGFAKDKNHVYRDGDILSNADPATFNAFDTLIGTAWSDKNNFVAADVVETEKGFPIRLDRTSFSAVYGYLNFGLTSYTKDKNYVYTGSLVGNQGKWYMTVIAGADPTTFQAVNDPTYKIDAQDKNHKYLGGQIVR